jgi:hypothetical protein
MRGLASTLLLTSVLAASVSAQELTASVSAYQTFGLADLDGELPPSFELRFTLPISERLAVEPFLTAGPWRTGRRSSLAGLGGAQIRQRILSLTGSDGFAFVTYGVALSHVDFKFFTDGADSQVPLGQFGAGVHRRVFKSLAFRPEVHLVTFHVVPIGARVAIGFTLDL